MMTLREFLQTFKPSTQVVAWEKRGTAEWVMMTNEGFIAGALDQLPHSGRFVVTIFDPCQLLTRSNLAVMDVLSADVVKVDNAKARAEELAREAGWRVPHWH